MILKTSIKYWPAEYHSQSAIEAALFLRKEIGDPSQVKSMTDRKPRCFGRHHRKRAGKMETGDARDGRPQSALHHGDRVDRWRSDRQAISAASVSRIRRSGNFSENVTVQRNDELSALYAEGGREHRARRIWRTDAR